MIRTAIAFTAALAATAPAQSQTTTCSMDGAFTHKTQHHGSRTVRTAEDALFFTAPLAVNTDGAPNSYHPDDPWGRSKAINTICNGANARLPSGRTLNYSSCRELITAFEEAKASGWAAPGKPRMDFYGIAAVGSKPCLIESGPLAGYFVSTTSQEADPSKPVCDQDRYLNSLELPFAIYPGHRNFTSRGVGKRDVVVIRNPVNGRTEFGIIGDRGPRWGLGEVSVHFARHLRDLERMPATRRDTYRFGVPKAHVLILSGVEIKPPYTLDKIRREGAAALAAWGGNERFETCIARFGR